LDVLKDEDKVLGGFILLLFFLCGSEERNEKEKLGSEISSYK